MRAAVSHIAGRSAGPLSRAGEGQGEGSGLSGEGASLTPALSGTGKGAGRGLYKLTCERRGPDGAGACILVG
ncbi:hypothetical protein FV228_01035 [Methylobacterium sp. WL18]|nr:hypothetical protein FV228_01035 [Methylobacterium sp. WL18]